MQTTKIVAGVFLFVAVAGAMLAHADGNDKELQSVSDCVANTAKAEGYHGNVYGSEAWTLFASECV